MENLANAEKLVVRHFQRFAKTFGPAERNDFFDPRNRDLWLSTFARFLEGQRDPDFPSND